MDGVGGENHSVLGDGRAEGFTDFIEGGPHLIGMVQPDVGDYPKVCPHHPVLRKILKRRINRHAFGNQNLRFLFGGAAENSELLLDVGSAVPDNGALAPVHIDGHRQTAGGFTEDPVSSGAKPGVDQPGDGGFPAGSVHIDHMGNLPAVAQRADIFRRQKRKISECEQKDQQVQRASPLPNKFIIMRQLRKGQKKIWKESANLCGICLAAGPSQSPPQKH